MSSQVTASFVGVFAALALAAGTMQGCGSSGNNAKATCEKLCDKVLECTPDAGALGQSALMQCKQNCSTQAMNQRCSNEGAIISAINNCLGMACTGALECIASVPPCQSTTGTGGTTGSGGSTGSGGTSGGGCAACTKADACCTGLGLPAAQCTTATSCTAAPADQQATINAACQSVLTQLAMQPNAPAACR